MSDLVEVYFDAVLDLTKAAGEIVRKKNSDRNKHVSIKTSPTDLVTETDSEVENFLITNISSKFPDHKFIGEESASNNSLTNDPTWIIDPIDGTMNFYHSFPNSCISIALHINKNPVIGIVYNPILEQLFTAKKGKGAYLNGERIRVSETKCLKQALLTREQWGGTPVSWMHPDVIKHTEWLLNNTHGFRCLGSAALDLCMIATGAADAFYNYGLKIWDIAAAELIVTEAGGVVTDTTGRPIDRFSKRILATSTKELHEELSKKLIELEDIVLLESYF